MKIQSIRSKTRGAYNSYGRIMCKKWFVRDGLIDFKVVVATLNGKVVELKTCSVRQAYYIDGKFKENDTVVFNCSVDAIEQPYARFSGANFKIGRWTLNHAQLANDDFNQFPECCTSIAEFRKSRKAAKSVVGILVGWENYDSQKQPQAMGRYFMLKDSNGLVFRALVWKPVDQNCRSPFDSYKVGDRILLLYAREKRVQNRPRMYTVTTVYPPVANSPCLNLNGLMNKARR